jgi:hypothetical protein
MLESIAVKLSAGLPRGVVQLGPSAAGAWQCTAYGAQPRDDDGIATPTGFDCHSDVRRLGSADLRRLLESLRAGRATEPATSAIDRSEAPRGATEAPWAVAGAPAPSAGEPQPLPDSVGSNDSHAAAPLEEQQVQDPYGQGRAPPRARSLLRREAQQAATARERLEPPERAISQADVLRLLAERPWSFSIHDRSAGGGVVTLTLVPAGPSAKARNASAAPAVEPLAIELLADVREVFAARRAAVLRTADLLAELRDLKGRPWAGETGCGITAMQLAALLRPFGIAPKSVRIGGETPKGYRLAAFAEAFGRNLGRSRGQAPIGINQEFVHRCLIQAEAGDGRSRPGREGRELADG